MYRIMCALVVGLLASAPSLAQSIVGTYKLASMEREVEGKPLQYPGAPAHGYLMITGKAYVLFLRKGRANTGIQMPKRRPCGEPCRRTRARIGSTATSS